MIIKRVNEGSNAKLILRFYDDADVLTVPSALEYRINCLDNRVELRDWTSLTPASQVEVNLTPEDNESVVATKAIEIHEVTVRAEYGGTDQITARYQYEVQNLRFLA